MLFPQRGKFRLRMDMVCSALLDNHLLIEHATVKISRYLLFPCIIAGSCDISLTAAE
jgi:hypothetical protein